MGFRNPITSVAAVDTGSGVPGVKVFADTGNPGSGVVEWDAYTAQVRGRLTSSQTGSGGANFSLAMKTGETLTVQHADLGGGTFQGVAAFTGVDRLEVPKLLVTGDAMSGALAGTAPPAGTPLVRKMWSGSVTGNAQGDATVLFPGGAFPNGLVGLSVEAIPAAAGPYEWLPWAPSLSGVNVRCYQTGSGTPVGSPVLTASVIAYGW